MRAQLCSCDGLLGSSLGLTSSSPADANGRKRTRSALKALNINDRGSPQKGDGASLMVADFVSADYRWLRSPDGKESARVLFKAGSS